ncbi:PHD transcription factor [Rasamsonia emersonii CBS 393.64]|uniref:PHD transcription factor n=1 Tax=Rasamsonia emersonii (strain ATCC 16479 / CBS 393.64 / IMI 116815) TaxID=1408163 RepID=A0A0F4Z5T0_RASE3|nr:PHD transcription factor [Rasamsonia emersonii CBS 393.64]KKA25456.1 PHD transcription factor [Rasamsonia emersonii CBS 393.64]
MAVNPYEADPKKVPENDPYLARSPHYGRYTPRPDDFTPRYNYWYGSEPESVPYWKEVLEQYCTPENFLNEFGTRAAFAAGKVIIRVDQEASDGPAAERYSFLNANELCAARKAEDVLKDLNVAVPTILFCGTIDGKNVTVESRIPGVSLEVAWRYLPEKERQNLKLQCRQILQRLASADKSPDAPSYVCQGLNTVSQPDMQELEREILFAKKEDGENLCLVHNDMTRSNIIVNNGRVVGILGWRRSGFFGINRAKRVHRQLRTPERSYLATPGEESAEEQAWADLYDELESIREPTAADGQEDLGPKVKTEPSATSLDKVPMSSTEGVTTHLGQLDGSDLPDEHPTPKKISDLKKGGSMSRASSSERSSPSAPSKLGPGGRKSSASTKKGTATKKTAPKKRKVDNLDADSVDGRSNTPSSRASKDPAGKKQGSASVAGSPAPDNKPENKRGGRKKSAKNAPEGEAAEEDSDVNADEVFCICRKPDNHTWMIGCDGGCEDWFHGKCVNIDPQDADLIDKYICPNCQAAGKGKTTWKPMCRLKGCRKPARLRKKNPSKYCSDEHGREFFRRMTQHLNLKSSSSGQQSGPNGRRGTTKDHHRDSHSVEGDVDSNMEDGAATNDEEEDDKENLEDLGSRGGVLTAGDLKAAIMGVSSAEEFRRLGDRLVSPPPPPPPPPAGEANGNNQQNNAHSNKMGLDFHPPNLTYSLDEEAKLQKLRKQRDDLLYRREMLRARNQFLALVRQRAKNVLERLKQTDPKGGWKDICGFDSRLSWNDDEFDEWRLSEAGKKALQEGNLEPEPVDNGAATATDADGDHQMADADANDGDDHDFEAFARGVCLKKRCERHKQWVKVHQQDVLFEESMVQQDLRKCEREAEAVVERAVLRMWAERESEQQTVE